MIVSFGNRLAEDIFDDVISKEVRAFPQELQNSAKRKITYINEARVLNDLIVPPGNRLEALKGDRVGYFSIRINSQWRIVFLWHEDNAYYVSIVDYH